MQPIKKITIEGFRGIRHSLELELNGQSLLIFGENSQGKSSISSALEWFFSPEHLIKRLRSESTGARDYPHLLVSDVEGDCSVEIVRGSETLQKTLQSSESLTPEQSDDAKFNALYDSFVVPPCLSYLDVAEFVLETKGKKYEILARWMGFENLVQEQLLLRDAHENVKQYLQLLKADKKAKEDALKRTTNLSRVDADKVLAYCNSLLEITGEKPLGSLDDLKEKIETLERKQFNARNERVVRMATAMEQIEAISFANIDAEIASVAKDGVDLVQATKDDPRARVEALYRAGLAILTDDKIPQDSCPFCATPWEQTTRGSRESLLQHIQGEIDGLRALQDKRASHAKNVSTSLTKLQSEKSSAAGLLTALGRAFDALGFCLLSVRSAAQSYADEVNAIISLLSTKKWSSINTENLVRAQRILVSETTTFLELLETEKTRSALSPKEQQMSDVLAKLVTANDEWHSLKETEKKEEFATAEAEKFSSICTAIKTALQESVQQSFDSVSESIGKYYSILRPPPDPCNQITDLKFRLFDSGRASGRVVDVEFTYHSRQGMTPPRKVMTDSHLNALGIATYLALARHLNANARFLVLDDVINSLDKAHRHNFAKLLATEFTDFQVIVLTHDDICFTYLIEQMRSAQHIKIVGWTFDGGPHVKKKLNMLEKVQKAIDGSEGPDAMHHLSLHIERRLNMLCEALGARTRHHYFQKASHPSKELFLALESACKSMGCPDSLQTKFTNLRVCTSLRNSTAHDWEALASTISPSEVQTLKDQWVSFESEFHCESCGQWIACPINEKFAICDDMCGQKRMPPVRDEKQGAPPIPVGAESVA